MSFLMTYAAKRQPPKNYVGRTNRNGTLVTRATFDRLDPEYVALGAKRHQVRALRWLAANPGQSLSDAPRHIRENAP